MVLEKDFAESAERNIKKAKILTTKPRVRLGLRLGLKEARHLWKTRPLGLQKQNVRLVHAGVIDLDSLGLLNVTI